ncbi:MAG TPA: TetR/AcrR family transcriptional regulator [Bryobacteraceae bacterium]|nr:TetR/AcrR family transcriptional regulator [Bryobacteraceae bacterium]
MSGTDRRNQLLEAALEVFSRKGFEGTTTKEVAAAAGVTEAIIFRHFPTKQALYTAVLDQHVESAEIQNWLAEIKGWMEQNNDREVLRSIARAILKSYRSDPRYERVLLFAALEGHELGLAHNRQMVAPIYELLRDYFAQRLRQGGIADLHPGAIIGAIAGMTKNHAMMTQMFGYNTEIPTDEEVIESFVRITMNGIRPSAVASNTEKK